jgi:hypothetical protein
MRRFVILAVVAALGACDDDGTSGNASMPGEWRSSVAHLEIGVNGTLIQFRDGDCYGSSGASSAPVRAGDFVLDGVFTQLMGIAPGRIDYPATFTGNATTGRIVITMTVPALSRTVGPLTLNPGTGTSLNACPYP